MNPEDFSQLLLKPGTLVGLIGSYDGASEWSHGEILKCTLVSYIVIERHDNPGQNNNISVWDTGAVVSSNQILKTMGSGSREYYGNRFLLIQRIPRLAWDNQDP